MSARVLFFASTAIVSTINKVVTKAAPLLPILLLRHVFPPLLQGSPNNSLRLCMWGERREGTIAIYRVKRIKTAAAARVAIKMPFPSCPDSEQ